MAARTFAISHLARRDPRALPTLVDTISEWLRGEAPYSARAMEPMNIALRIREWIWVLMLVGRDPGFPGFLAVAMRRSLAQQAARLSRHIEYETPGNHPVINLIALWLVSAMFARQVGGRGADAWARLLEREAERSFLPDGFHVELSTHYHAQTCRLLEEYAWLAHAVGQPPSESFQRKLRSWRHVLAVMASPGGPFPIIGDQCYP
jgi:hypothetical protein